MKHNREFEIAWQGLKPGQHVYEYEVGDRFMTEHGGEQDFQNLRAEVKLIFDKKANFFLLHFDVGGNVTVPCDRCGDEFEMKLWDEFDLVIKLAGEDAVDIEDDDADVVFIPRHETVLDISKWVYEFLLLSIPLQRVHPDGTNQTPTCNPEALKLLNRLSEHAEEKKRNVLWQGLETLKNKDKKKQ